jgi:ATP-dependent protease ClpP protease subunit
MQLLLLFVCIICSVSCHTIDLNDTNYVTLIGEIDDTSYEKFISDLISIESKLVYIYIDSPGGSMVFGIKMINAVNEMVNNNTQIECIAMNAMSAAFTFFQNCPVRYITKNSVLMQHQPTIRFNGSIANAEYILNVSKYYEKLYNEIDLEKINITSELYNEFIRNDWYISGQDALYFNAADAIVDVHRSDTQCTNADILCTPTCMTFNRLCNLRL